MTKRIAAAATAAEGAEGAGLCQPIDHEPAKMALPPYAAGSPEPVGQCVPSVHGPINYSA